jgi:hypothetical protein
MYELNTQRTCVKVYDDAKQAESARMHLLSTGVKLAWADDTRDDFIQGFGVYVQECDARGAYARLKLI